MNSDGYRKIVLIFSVLSASFLFVSAGGTESDLDKESVDKLPQTRWELISLDGRPVIPGTSITLEFDRKSLSGSAGCNSYSGEYSGGKKGILKTGLLISTTMACLEPEGILEQESDYLALLDRADGFSLSGNVLKLTVSSVKGNPYLDFMLIESQE